jgi:hypothetical protein
VFEEDFIAGTTGTGPIRTFDQVDARRRATWLDWFTAEKPVSRKEIGPPSFCAFAPSNPRSWTFTALPASGRHPQSISGEPAFPET